MIREKTNKSKAVKPKVDFIKTHTGDVHMASDSTMELYKEVRLLVTIKGKKYTATMKKFMVEGYIKRNQRDGNIVEILN